ncbi:MAG TPA: hypothetical protein VIC57_20650 [Candidatus Dormibacteraeota bacterium]
MTGGGLLLRTPDEPLAAALSEPDARRLRATIAAGRLVYEG